MQPSLSDPAGSNVLLAAVSWLQGTMLGTAATAVATLCVAWIGAMMLTGRLPVRRGLGAILGCFILFGAPTMAAGLQSAVAGIAAGTERPEPPPPYVPPPPSPPPTPAPPAPAPPPADPYAGAAVPPR